MLKQSQRFTKEDIDKIERISSVMGRCHENVNKVEALFGMRTDMNRMDQVSTTILNQIEENR